MKYLDSLIINRAPETARVLKSLCENHFENYVNKDIDVLFKEWKNKGLKSATIKKLLTIYSAWAKYELKKEVDLKYYYFNLDREDKKEIQIWNKEQARKALDFCKVYDYKYYLSLLIGLHTGVRPGEALGLIWRDVDFNNKKIWVRRSRNNPTKNGVKRSIKLTEELASALLYFKNLTQPNEDKNILPYWDLNVLLKFVCGELNLPKITYHKLRHSFATLGLDAGISIREISKILGHKHVSTTLNTYWQSTKEIDINFAP